MPHNQVEKLREEYRKACLELSWTSPEESDDVADWWLSKLDLALLEQKREMREMIGRLKDKDYFEHRVGAHSDDFGGESDLPCYCNKTDSNYNKVIDEVCALLTPITHKETKE